MNLPPSVRALLIDPRLRLALTFVIALMWFLLVVAGEQGRNAAPAVIVGIPAMAVLFRWRLFPLQALGLSVLALLLAVLTAWFSSLTGPTIALATVWLSVLGASASSDRRTRLLGAGVAALFGVAALLVFIGYGGASGALTIVFLLALAYGLGWAWRQVRQTDRLRAVVAQTHVRADTAERDVVLEVERNRIAREVHDVVAHSLAVVIAQADGARFAAESKPETVAPALDAIADTARRALGEVRTMLHDLRTSGEGGTAPGAEDLDGLVEGVRGLGVDVEEAVFGEPRPLTRETGLALYRVAQEALTNAVRHGDRTRPVGFEVDWGEREVVLVVTNAVPDQAVPATERAGHGVEGMTARAADAGGDCTAGVGSNGVFRVRVALPVAAEPEPAPEPAPNPLIALFRSETAEPRAS